MAEDQESTEVNPQSNPFLSSIRQKILDKLASSRYDERFTTAVITRANRFLNLLDQLSPDKQESISNPAALIEALNRHLADEDIKLLTVGEIILVKQSPVKITGIYLDFQSAERSIGSIPAPNITGTNMWDNPPSSSPPTPDQPKPLDPDSLGPFLYTFKYIKD